MFNNILHPDRYHGFNAQAPFFEGWYYKLVSADEETRFVVIPGVYMASEEENSHCFVQVFDSQADAVQFHRYPYEAFKASKNSFEINVGLNYFSAERIDLAIDDDIGRLKGSLSFDGLSRWPVRLISPGAMGWFAWVPFMETYHGVVSFDHIIRGDLKLDGKQLGFSGGRGYIEKDWGKQFPSAWIWGQSNHFDRTGISLMLSVAVVPWLWWSFAGFVIGFLFDGVVHRFATYNRSKIESLSVEDTTVDLVVRNASHRLRIKARRAEGGLLQAPTLVEMDRRIIETLNASLEIQFEDLSGKVLYRGVGQHAGLETVGDLEHLVGMVR